MFGYKVHYWRWFGTVKQTVAAADELDLAYALGQRQIIKSRETNPITHERQAVPQHKGKFGFLWIAQAPIAEIELARCVLLRNQKPRRLGKKFLQVVIFHRRLLIELDDCRLFSDGDFRAGYFRHDVLAHLPEIVVRCWSCNRFACDCDPPCFCCLRITRLLRRETKQYRQRNERATDAERLETC